MEVEWGHYTDTFVGMAAELCDRTSGERSYTKKQKPRMDGRNRWRRLWGRSMKHGR